MYMTAVETIKKVIESYKLTKINSEQMIDEILELIDNNCLEMEKQQIIDAYWDGCSNWDSETEAEQYYEQKFNK